MARWLIKISCDSARKKKAIDQIRILVC